MSVAHAVVLSAVVSAAPFVFDGGAARGVAAAAPPEFLTKAREAIGGQDALAEIHSVHLAAELTISGNGSGAPGGGIRPDIDTVVLERYTYGEFRRVKSIWIPYAMTRVVEDRSGTPGAIQFLHVFSVKLNPGDIDKQFKR